jgi:D-alanine-D-alanine ligase
MESAMRKLPAELEKETEDKIKALAQQAFQALHCNGVARVDFLYDQAGGRVYINELNTIPGSLSFYLWEAEGKPFRQLTEELIQLALKRNRIQERIIWSNEVNLLSGAAQGIKGLKG